MIKRFVLVVLIALTVIFVPWFVSMEFIYNDVKFITSLIPLYWLSGLLVTLIGAFVLVLVTLFLSGVINYIINGEWCTYELLDNGYDRISDFFENLDFSSVSKKIKNKFY